MSTIPPPRYYVYVLCRPDKKHPGGKPFYVGKGKGPRVFTHEEEARRGHKCHKCNVIRKVWKQGGEVQRYIVFTTDDEAGAYTYEAELIELYGLGTLTNKSTGGRGGGTGRIISDETRAKKRMAAKAQWVNPEIRNRNRAGIAVAKQSPESRARSSAKMKAHWADPEQRARHSAINAAHVCTPEARERISAASKAAWQDPDYRAQHDTTRLGELTKARWEDPEYRVNERAAIKARRSTPEARARQSELTKARWANPEYRARMTAQLQAQAHKASKAGVEARRRKKENEQ